jgi:hypothetical protein
MGFNSENAMRDRVDGAKPARALKGKTLFGMAYGCLPDPYVQGSTGLEQYPVDPKAHAHHEAWPSPQFGHLFRGLSSTRGKAKH